MNFSSFVAFVIQVNYTGHPLDYPSFYLFEAAEGGGLENIDEESSRRIENIRRIEYIRRI